MKLIIDSLPENLLNTLVRIRDELKIINVDVVPKYEHYFYPKLITKYSIYESELQC